MNNFENIRVVKYSFAFDGTVGNGANGSVSGVNSFSGVQETLDQGEFIYQIYYDTSTVSPLTSGDTAGTYLQIGLLVDDADCILNSTTGIVDTLNSNNQGILTTPAAFQGAQVDGRNIVFEVGGTDDITGGSFTIFLFIVRANVTEQGLADSLGNPPLAIA